jgi:DNA-binding MarR family transcriptional regulator
MQQLQQTTLRADSAEGCAAELLETVPAMMRFIRAQMRQHRRSDLSVPQFRALVFVSRNSGTSLTAVADFLALSLPATSRLVEGLVRRDLIDRLIPPDNRRQVALSVNAHGCRVVSAARQATEKSLADVLAPLARRERVAVHRVLRVLRGKFEGLAPRS